MRFIRKRNKPYLPLPSQPQLVLIYPPRRDGRLSRHHHHHHRPWCEVAPAEIRTRNLPIANPELYHTATSALVHGAYRTIFNDILNSEPQAFQNFHLNGLTRCCEYTQPNRERNFEDKHHAEKKLSPRKRVHYSTFGKCCAFINFYRLLKSTTSVKSPTHIPSVSKKGTFIFTITSAKADHLRFAR